MLLQNLKYFCLIPVGFLSGTQRGGPGGPGTRFYGRVGQSSGNCPPPRDVTRASAAVTAAKDGPDAATGQSITDDTVFGNHLTIEGAMITIRGGRLLALGVRV